MAYESIKHAENEWICGRKTRGYVEKYIVCTFVGTRGIYWHGDMWQAVDRYGEVLATGSPRGVIRYK